MGRADRDFAVAAAWWDGGRDGWGRPGAWAGGGVVVVLALLHFLAGLDFGLGDVFTMQTVLDIVMAWVTFVVSAEGAYQVAGPLLPRKRV